MHPLNSTKDDSGRARKGSSTERLARDDNGLAREGYLEQIAANFHNPRSRRKVYIAGQL